MTKPVFKLFWLLLCVLILEGCGERQGSQPQGSERQEVLFYRVGDTGATVANCDDAVEGEVVIPDEIEGLPVTAIGDIAFSRCTNLTSITIPDSVTSIGDDAFNRCSSLTSINIPNSVLSIGEWAFSDCSNLSSITINDSVTSIGPWAFDDCISLTSIAIPDSVTSIGDLAFLNCKSLTSITIPQAFHSEAEARRLGLDELWPDGFLLPDSSSK